MASRLLFVFPRQLAARALSLALLAVLLFTSTYASAQAATVTVAPAIVRRDDRRSGLDVKTITYGDCVADEEIEFGVNVAGSGLTGAEFEIWAGSSDNCENEDERGRLEPTGCWRVWSGETTARTARIRAQDIIPHGASGAGTGTAAVCDDPDLSDDGLTLYFMVLDGNNRLGGTTLGFSYDLSGPEPPRLRSLGGGEGRVLAKWDASDDDEIAGYRIYCEPAGDPVAPDPGTSGAGGTGGIGGASATGATAGEMTGGTAGDQAAGGTTAGTAGSDTGGTAFAVAGSDAGGTAGTAGTAGDAGNAGTGGNAGSTGASGDGGADPTGGETAGGAGSGTAGRSSGNGCPAPTLRAGQRPPANLRRGRAVQTAKSGAGTGLTNYVPYACGVAAYDQDENVGVLSEILCATPEPVIDYFEAYRGAGGQAGGGFCAFGRASSEVAGAAFALSALAVALRRRARRGGSR